MQKMLVRVVAFLIISLIFCVSGVLAANDEVSICVTYKKQSGFSTNQFAIWVENAHGDYIKTIYVTSFTAGGGFSKRPASIPLWVSNSGIKNQAARQVDAFSGPTPKSGRLCYGWDLTDTEGNRVADGDYNILVAGTVGENDQIIYAGSITVSDMPVKINPVAKFSSKKAEKSQMLTNLEIVYVVE